MGRWWSYLLFLIWLSYLFVCGIFLFTRGFLLSRQALPNNSTCIVSEKCKENGRLQETELGMRTRYSPIDCLDWDQIRLLPSSEFTYACKETKHKIIILVIDALKYEFAVFNTSVKEEDSLPFQNKMIIFHELLQTLPNNTRLLKFIANPPTTTLQRLKGLTTGSLPTFIDAGMNFGTSEIDEDNILNQIQSQNKHIILMGDDTWVNLFPNKTIREYPYPSFNIPDLDTVDTAVKRHLKQEIYKKDWTLIVAHFLGVDHCGHTYGPYHAEMSRKLMEMNNVIRDLVDTIDDDTLLLVMGDHGMSSTGDHGGDSEDEVSAALFVYSPKPFLDPVLTNRQTSIYQVDIVPTLAFLLGTAIPFSNLGKVALELLPRPLLDDAEPASCVPYAMEALIVNIEQIMLYINTYTKYTHLFSKDKISSIAAKFHDLRDGLDQVRDIKSFNVFRTKSLRFLNFVRELFEEIWVQFDSFLMSRGLVLTFLLLTFSFIIIEGIPGDRLVEVLEGGFIFYAYSVLLVCTLISALLQFFEFVDDGVVLTCVSSLTLSVFMMAVLVVQNWSCVSALGIRTYKIRTWFEVLPRFIYVLSLFLFFSNSYIVEEAQVLIFLLLTTVGFSVASVSASLEIPVSAVKPKKENKSFFSRLLTRSKIRSVLFATCFALILRASFYFWRCREEQRWCLKDVSKIGRGGVSTLATFVLLGLFTTAVRMWLRGCGNLVGFSPAITLARYSPTVMVVCIGGFWMWPRDHRTVQLLPWQQQLLPWSVFFFLTVGVTTTILQPLCVYVVEKKTEFMSVYGRENIIPQLFHQVKEVMSKSSEKSRLRNETPLVYGLATAYSAVFIVLGTYLTLLFVLLLGDLLAPSAVLHFAAAGVFIFLVAYIRLESSLVVAQLFHVPWHFVIIWGLLTSYFFYATGHQPTITNIHWRAAFVGTTGHMYSKYISAFLIGVNTFSAQLFGGIALPLLFIAPFTLFIMLPRWLHLSSDKETKQLKEAMWSELKQGELLLYEKEGLTQYAAFKLAANYMLFHATRMFACMLAAAFHCRHLMVWKIFAPRFIFEGLSFFVTVGSTLLGFVLLARISSKVDQVITALLRRRS